VTVPRDAAAHAFVSSLDAPVLADDDRHHLERVLRVRAGTVITVSDGQGRWRPVVFGPDLECCGEIVQEPAASPEVTIAFAVVKGDRPELIARALTEIGVDRLVPMLTNRGVVRWEEARAAGAVERLRRVVRGAAGQCRRSWLPKVDDVAPFADVAGRPGVALAVPGAPLASINHPTVLIGPEGGWSAEELSAPAARVGLGPHVLRTETAAIVAGALLVAARARFA
jgi:16S rRNA (uracil1498-N3)-methyltransferase